MEGLDVCAGGCASRRSLASTSILQGCVEKAGAAWRGAAAAEGAQLALLPECFVPIYPMSRLTHSNWDSRQTDLFEQAAVELGRSAGAGRRSPERPVSRSLECTSPSV